MSWLDELKPGDKVIERYGRGWERLVSVDRVTKTWIVACGLRYSKKDGRSNHKIPSWQERSTLVKPTPKRLAEVEKAELVAIIGGLRSDELSSLPLSTLRQIHKLVFGE